jgi:hypothetical protein
MKAFARWNQHRSTARKIRRSQRGIAGSLPGGVVAGLVLLTLTACGSSSSGAGGGGTASASQLTAFCGDKAQIEGWAQMTGSDGLAPPSIDQWNAVAVAAKSIAKHAPSQVVADVKSLADQASKFSSGGFSSLDADNMAATVGRIEQFVADNCSRTGSGAALSGTNAEFCAAAATATSDGGNVDFAALPGQLKADVSALVIDLKAVLKVSPKEIAPSVKKELAGVIEIQKILASHGYTADAKTQDAIDKLSTNLSLTDDVVTKYVDDTCGNG